MYDSNYSNNRPNRPSGGAPGMAVLTRDTRSMNFAGMLLASFLLHALFVGMIVVIVALAAFFHWDIFNFDALNMKPREIQFVLVNKPEEQPLNKNTKNRAKHASRTGGVKTSEPKDEPMKKAGSPTPRPKPKPVSKPKPKPQPKKAAKKPTPKPRPRPKTVVKKPTPKPNKPKIATKTPPRPTLKKPVKTPVKLATLPPNPIAPTIKTPAPPTPKIASAGPVINSRPRQSKSGRTTGPVSPSQIPGATTRGSRKSTSRSGRPSKASAGNPAWSQGRGGRGAYNQNGSPGGGPGRPGVDALPDPDFGPYMDEVKRRIKRNWRPPTAQEDKRIRVLFKVAKDGRLTSLVVEQSSGSREADQAALAAVKLSAPFRPLPVGYRYPEAAIQFMFDYNVEKHSGSFSARRR